MSPRLFLSLLPLLFALPPAHADDAERTPRYLIDHLGVEIRQILADPKAGRTPEDAERAVAAQITALIQRAEGHLSLTDRDDRGRSPLMLAVSGGYALVVQALLADPAVKLRINEPDADGETAWMMAQFAPSVTLPSCQPGALTRERYPLLPPYLLRMGHLMKTKPLAVNAIVEALEDAGAQPDRDGAKRAWLARCPNTRPELRQALESGALLPMLVQDTIQRVNEFSKTARENVGKLPTSPPEGMKFINASAEDRPRQVPRLLKLGETRCEHVEKPQLFDGRITWTGTVSVRGIVSTRAGVVEVADFETITKKSDPHIVEYLRAMILRALAGYRCIGDYVFEQEFMLVVD